MHRTREVLLVSICYGEDSSFLMAGNTILGKYLIDLYGSGSWFFILTPLPSMLSWAGR
jgi:hypothetical protein